MWLDASDEVRPVSSVEGVPTDKLKASLLREVSIEFDRRVSPPTIDSTSSSLLKRMFSGFRSQ
jgi:hypothetical protein